MRCAVLRADGVVVVHDCNPQSAAAAAPSLEEAARTDGFIGEWNGDVYRAIVRLRTRGWAPGVRRSTTIRASRSSREAPPGRSRSLRG